PDHGISMREMPSTPHGGHRRGGHVKGFVEQEYVWLGALAQANQDQSEEPHEGGARWFDMSTPQVDVDYEKRFGPSVPFALEAVYHRELKMQNYERWRDEHAKRDENRKPKEITFLNDARLQPGKGDKLSAVGMRYRTDDVASIPKEHQPHIQVARYGHDLWCRKRQVERMKKLLNQIIISWRSYLYWLRLSLLKAGQKVPENGESLTFQNGYVIEGHILRRFSFGEGDITRQEHGIYEAIDKGEIFTHNNETALAEVCETWSAF
ncbi:hypothetical protein QBC40DRAFT_134882, partial [Triangularia verruculosa]